MLRFVSGTSFGCTEKQYHFAGVVKLVDALDSKSSGLHVHVGSTPTSGTSNTDGLGQFGLTRFFFCLFPL